MKQLKFMLAAATAVGIAAAAQAADQTNELANDTFDTDVALSAAYTYIPAGDNDNDNESAIVEGGYNSSAKALKVNTGTNPLLRSLDWSGSAARPVSLANVKSLYIDTMVQFTVTPDGDTVTAGDEDKLMIYLKEVPADGDTPASTKLMVKAGKVVVDDVLGEITGVEPNDYAVTADGLTVVPNQWYNLKVYAVNDNGLAVFTIFIDGKPLKAGVSLGVAGDVDGLKFPSLKGIYDETSNPDAISLTYVGFAGEGMVDDLTVATITEQTSVDFTFTLSWGDGISAVTYTIAGEETAKEPVNGQAFTVPGTGSFTISYTLDSWYTLNVANPTLTYDFAPNGSGSLDLATTKLTSKEDGEGNVVVNPNASVAEVQAAAGITEGAFADANTSKSDLQAALNWKKNCNANGKADINKITFSGVEPTSDEAEAYLLNCDPEELETAKDNFKFEASDLAKLFDVENTDALSFDSKNYNGSVILEGKEELSGEWKVKAVGHKFFRARLVK